MGRLQSKRPQTFELWALQIGNPFIGADDPYTDSTVSLPSRRVDKNKFRCACGSLQITIRTDGRLICPECDVTRGHNDDIANSYPHREPFEEEILLKLHNDRRGVARKPVKGSTVRSRPRLRLV